MRFAPRSAEHHRSVGTMRRSDEDQRRQPAELAFKSSRAEPSPAALHADTALWWEIELLAADMAAREPVLRQIVEETWPFDATPARIVSGPGITLASKALNT